MFTRNRAVDLMKGEEPIPQTVLVVIFRHEQ